MEEAPPTGRGLLHLILGEKAARDLIVTCRAAGVEAGLPAPLEGIGRSHLQDGNTVQAAIHLRQAIAIYQRPETPSPSASRKPCDATGSCQPTTRSP